MSEQRIGSELESVQVREVHAQDAERFLGMCHSLDAETDFMLMERGERQTGIDEQKSTIERILSAPNQTMLMAEHLGVPVGFVVAIGGAFRRNCHCATVVIGIKQSWWGQGIGGRLLDAVERWAADNAVHRLELTVMSRNRRALSLYNRMGFAVEGERRESLYVNEAYVNEYYMAKLIV